VAQAQDKAAGTVETSAVAHNQVETAGSGSGSGSSSSSSSGFENQVERQQQWLGEQTSLRV